MSRLETKIQLAQEIIEEMTTMPNPTRCESVRVGDYHLQMYTNKSGRHRFNLLNPDGTMVSSIPPVCLLNLVAACI